MRTDRFDRIEPDDEDRPKPRPSPRFDLLRDVLRRRRITEAEDKSLADPDHRWHPIRGGNRDD